MEATSHTPSRESVQALHSGTVSPSSQSAPASSALPESAAPRSVPRISPEALARSLYGKLRAEGLNENDIMAFVGELMGLVASEMRDKSTDG